MGGRESLAGKGSSMQRLMIILFEISAMWPMGVQIGVADPADIVGVSEVHKWALGEHPADSL